MIPVITVGGYLGAGKTTLLNALLAGDHGRRIAMLVNDFGSISIDEKLIAARDGDIVTLANGCACCSVAGDLGKALDGMARARTPPDYVVIEASGAADPARIAALAHSPGLAPGATIVLAESGTIAKRARDKFVGRLVRRQLAAADLLVLNKIDIADSDSLRAARSLIETEAPAARVIETSYAAVAPDLVLGAAGRAGAFVCDTPEQDASAIFESHRWTTAKAVDIRALRDALAALPATVVRAKGVVVPFGGGPRSQLHRVGESVVVAPLADVRHAAPGAELTFVALKDSIDRQAIDAAMNTCVSSTEVRR